MQLEMLQVEDFWAENFFSESSSPDNVFARAL